MIEFIDKTSESAGTPLNRANLMGVQGFESAKITFNSDGSITETNSQGQVYTVNFNRDGSISEKFIGTKTITKTTTFNDDGSITEVIS